MSWVNNPWIVSLCTGVVTTLATWFLSKLFLTKTENREYRRKIDDANRDIVMAVRPGIAEAQFPNQETLRALVNSTARKYQVTPADLFNAHQVAEELVKEVMDSSFISATLKAEYCAKLVPPGRPAPPTQVVSAVINKTEDKSSMRDADYRSKIINWASMVISLFAGIMTGLLVIVPKVKGESLHLDRLRSPFLVVGMALIASFVSILAVQASNAIVKERRRREFEKSINAFRMRAHKDLKSDNILIVEPKDP